MHHVFAEQDVSKKAQIELVKRQDLRIKELEEKEIVKISFGRDLSWKYLTWVRNHSFVWNHPTAILYGNYDNLQSIYTIQTFARECEATITVMKNGEHWFHTEEQMKFLDQWICS